MEPLDTTPYQDTPEAQILAGLKAKREAAAAAAQADGTQIEQPASPLGQAQQTPPALKQTAQGIETQQGQADATAPAAENLVSVTYKGDDGADVTENVPLDELRSSYLRRSDYSRKTAEVAKERESIPAKVEAGIAEARNAYLQSMQTFEKLVIAAVAPEFQNVNWQQLAAENPTEYVRLRGKADVVQNTLQAIRAQQEHQKLQAEGKEKEAKQKRIADAWQTLTREIPGWSGEAYNKLLLGAQKTYGYSIDDYGNRTDARDLMVLNDALKYRDLMAKKPATEAAIKAAPQAIRPGAAPQRTDADRARIETARKALQGTGEIDDAVALRRAKRGAAEAQGA